MRGNASHRASTLPAHREESSWVQVRNRLQGIARDLSRVHGTSDRGEDGAGDGEPGRLETGVDAMLVSGESLSSDMYDGNSSELSFEGMGPSAAAASSDIAS